MASDTSRIAAQTACTAGPSWALLTSEESVCWVTGMSVPVETGTSPFVGGPHATLVSDEGNTVVVVPNLDEGCAAASLADQVVPYDGYTLEEPTPLVDNFLQAIGQAMDTANVSGQVAVESSLPLSVAHILSKRGCPQLDLTTDFRRARAIKTTREMDLLRRSASVAARGQEAAKQAVGEGRSELEIFSDIRCAMESAAGFRLPIAGDLISGPDRTAQAVGWPGTRRIYQGDLVITDLAPRVSGYWGDSCNTQLLGEPKPEIRRMFSSVERALRKVSEMAGPGVVAGDIDRVARESLSKDGYEYPHHTGHGIGTGVHEYPRIVPGHQAELQTGMVILLEPGAFVPGVGGVRLEWMFIVTNSGLERLTEFEFSTPQ